MGWSAQFNRPFPSLLLLRPQKAENLIEESEEEKKGRDGRNPAVSVVLRLHIPPRRLLRPPPLPGRASPLLSTQLPPDSSSTAPPSFLALPGRRRRRRSQYYLLSPHLDQPVARRKKNPGLTRRRREAAEIWARGIRRPFSAALRRGCVGEFPCRRGSAWCQTKPARVRQFGREKPKGSLHPLPSRMVVRL